MEMCIRALKRRMRRVEILRESPSEVAGTGAVRPFSRKLSREANYSADRRIIKKKRKHREDQINGKESQGLLNGGEGTW